MMFLRKVLIPSIIVLCAFSRVSAQEEQWTDYLGKSFDSVAKVLKENGSICDTHTVRFPTPALVISCMPYEFMDQKGILILRRSKTGIIKSCSWVRGQYPGFKDIMEGLDDGKKEELAVKFGELDHVFSTLWNHYDQKLGATYLSTDDGTYLWKPDQRKQKNIQYSMSRSLDYIEFTVSLTEQAKQKSRPKETVITKN